MSLKCQAGEVKVAEHCRLAKQSADSASHARKRAEIKGIKEALKSIQVPAMLPLESAKTVSKVTEITLMNSLNEMPDLVAACVQEMLKKNTAKSNDDMNARYAKATSHIKGSANQYIKRAVFSILLSIREATTN